MAGWLHGVFVGEWLFVFPLCGCSISLFCNYIYVACTYSTCGTPILHPSQLPIAVSTTMTHAVKAALTRACITY